MANRTTGLAGRAVLTLVGLILMLQAGATLREGVPDYRNHYNQPVSAHVAFLLGAALAVGSLAPWPRRSSAPGEPSPRRVARRASVDRPGRNETCPCGSGRKYKRCCLASDEDWQRAESLRQRSAALNHSNGETSITAVVNRGLSGQ